VGIGPRIKTAKGNYVMKHNRVKDIQDLGQSIWLDFFDRKIMDTGLLKNLIENDGIKGVTANPSIFEKAINSSPDYNKDIATLSKQKSSNDDIFFSLAVKDIRRAADLFSSVYDETNGDDGFVSLEVSPHLAHDTEATIKQARELWKAIDRKNVMIKIPATAQGLSAIRQCISEGINTNVTLLFGLPRYEQVTDAYISGLEDRIKTNQPIDQIASVASFFLSRIDVLIDPLLEEKDLGEMTGEVAIASAKKAYEIYKEVFKSERFKKLEAKGAKRQRVLWASTSSKDPSFSDVKYVEALIGRETINTIPIETLVAFNDHGMAESHLEDNLDQATHLMKQLKEKGIDINSITQTLEDEGIEKFNTAYDKLLETIEKQKQTVR
jgi:transaldolase